MVQKRLRKLLIGDFSAIRLIRSLIFIYAMVCVYIFKFADGMIFLPQPSSYQDSSSIIKLSNDDGTQLAAVYLPNRTSRYTILYAHGNAEDLGDIKPVLKQLQEIGLSVFAYDYRGYGLSTGKPTEANAYRDIDTAYGYLTQELGVAAESIIAYGRSVGAGSAVDLASRKPIAGLVIESGFTSAFRTVVPFPIFPFDKFPNLDKIQRVTCPVLVMHGTEDEVIPFNHGQKLFALAPQPKLALWVESAGHNDLVWVAEEQYQQILQQFLQLLR